MTLNPWFIRLVYAVLSSLISAASFIFSQEFKRVSKALDNYDKVVNIILEQQNQMDAILRRLDALEK